MLNLESCGDVWRRIAPPCLTGCVLRVSRPLDGTSEAPLLTKEGWTRLPRTGWWCRFYTRLVCGMNYEMATRGFPSCLWRGGSPASADGVVLFTGHTSRQHSKFNTAATGWWSSPTATSNLLVFRKSGYLSTFQFSQFAAANFVAFKKINDVHKSVSVVI